MDTRNYIRVDDHLPENPKIVQVSDSAAWLYVSGLCYCGRFQTDGRIPRAVVPRLVHKGGKQHAKALVKAELWHDRGDFFEVHDYLEHQRSRSEIEARRQAKRQAGAKGGAASSAQRKAKQSGNRSSSEINPDNREQISDTEKSNSPNGLSDESARKPTADQTWVEERLAKLEPHISSGEISPREAFEDIFNFAFEANGKGPQDPLNAAKFILVAYLRAVEDREPRREEWPLMGKLVKEYGKRAFTGFAEAIAKTPEDWFRYARGVLREKAS